MPKSRTICPDCGKRVKSLAMHARAKHAAVQTHTLERRSPVWWFIFLAVAVGCGLAVGVVAAIQ